MGKRSKGLGDRVEDFTKATGIKAVVKWVFGEDCGCNERKEYLNNLFKGREEPECLTEEEYNLLKEYFSYSKYAHIPPHLYKGLIKIYNRVFDMQQLETNCAKCNEEIHEKMLKVFKTYKDGSK